MKLGGIAQSPIEVIASKLGLLPQPLLDTQIAMLLARTIMEGARLGVFEALKDGPLTAAEVAARCGGQPRPMAKLLDALAGCEYLHYDSDVRYEARDGAGRYELAPVARKWLLAGPRSLGDKMLMQFWEWDSLDHLDGFVRTGKPLDLHQTLTPENWGLYQRGMRATAASWAPEVGKRTPVPKGARDMLDLGGSHGLLSVAICRRHPGLRSVVLDLPQAVEHAAPLLAQEGMGDRVVHRAGDALTDDLGAAAWDLIFVSSLVHHFDDATNRDLAQRIARALRPGGIFVIQEHYRPGSPKEAGQIGALLDLFFALTSQAGTWSFAEMAGWQREAGLRPLKPIKFLTAPGTGQQSAVKRR
jgi:SAM-dependent methyltransferase